MKTCTKCDTEKHLDEFSKHSKRKDGLQSSCKTCAAEYKLNNSDRIKSRGVIYRKLNHDRVVANTAAWHKANPDKVKAHKYSYYDKNRKKIAAASAIWCAANPEKRKAAMAAWFAANPELRTIYNRNRRALKRFAEGTHTATDINLIFAHQRGLCANCHAKLFKTGPNKLHVDHIVALSNGGSNDKYNLQCLCPTCNLRKHAKDPIAWANENGRLL